MAIILLCIGIYAMLFTLIYYSFFKPAIFKTHYTKSSIHSLWFILVLAFVTRLFIASTIEGHTTDITCFKSWADMAFSGGLSNFYGAEAFTDYPPGYMYVLWLIGAIKSLFNIEYSSAIYTLLIKLPAIICDLISGYFLYSLLKKYTNTTLSLCLVLLYLFNPAIIINSAAWGQVDSVFTLFVILFIYYINEHKLLNACIFYTIGLIIKPQVLIFTPILLLYLYKLVFVDTNQPSIRNKAIKEIFTNALICFALIFVLTLPFTKNFNFMPVIKQYISTLASYPYASVNAFNVFALFGGIWRNANEPFLLLSYNTWSNIAIVLTVAMCIYVFIKQKHETNMFLLAAFIITAVFTFAAKMHERYVFPALILLCLAFSEKKDTRIIGAFALLSTGQFLNTASMLYQNIVLDTTAPPSFIFVAIVSLINIASFIYLTYILLTPKNEMTNTVAKTKKASNSNKPKKRVAAPFSLMPSSPKMHLTRTDAIIMIAVTLIYTVVALVNLGDMKAPETKWDSMYIGDGISVIFDENTYIDKMKWFTGSYEERNVSVAITDGNGLVTELEQSLGSVFCWHEYPINSNTKKIEIKTLTYDTAINEIAFTDKENNLIAPVSISAIQQDCGIKNLTDEQNLVADAPSYKNGTYFDEIYHARTAYEYINALNPYENTHPPLGKLIIAIGMLIFGVNPFGWRIMGTLFGALMLPCIYIFAKKLFKNTTVSFAAIMLLACDFMHFAQTRIATIDVYITFFIMLMYFFMYDYVTKSFYTTSFKKTLVPLAASGICMGLGISTKWTGVYAGIGLGVIFFSSFARRIYEYKKVMSNPHSSAEQKAAVSVCKKYSILTILWCVVFFVIVPAIIYVLSYIPYLRAPGMDGFKSIIENQFSMFSYHSTLTDTHPFSSYWYEWPIILRPIWYYSGTVSDTIKMSIASFGNPFIWWAGIGAFVFCLYKTIKSKSLTATFLVLAFFSQYLPWVGVTRVVFIYHYFTCVPFVVLMLSYLINDFISDKPAEALALSYNKKVVCVCIYIAVCLLAFIAFYPVLSGMQVSEAYINSLRWYDSWIF